MVLALAGCGGTADRPDPAPPAAASTAAWTPAATDGAHRALDEVAGAILRAQASGLLVDLLDARDRLDATVAALRRRHGPLPAEVEDRVARLENAVERRIVAAKRRALALQSGLRESPEATDPDAGGPTAPEPPVADRVLRWPLDRLEITSPFGHRLGVMSDDGEEVKFHDGVDLRARDGEPVRACASGTVIAAHIRGGYGLMVSIAHGLGVETHYAHLDSTDVLAGQRVSAGEIIGRAGASGRSTGTHLHLMVTVRGRKIDPMDALGARLGDLAGSGR